MEFLAPKTQSIMSTYQCHEAELMIDTLTKDCRSKREKVIVIIKNFRNNRIFAEKAFKFFTIEFLGSEGPIRLKQGAFLIGYLILLAMIWIMNGFARQSIVISLWFVMSLFSFSWVGLSEWNSSVTKLNVMMDLKNPKHLITSILKQIEAREFEQLEQDSYESNLHCYECLIVK